MIKAGIVGATGYVGAELVRLLALHPALRVAALAEDRAVARICRSLDEQDVGWLPLSLVQHADGSGELILRAKAQRTETDKGDSL